MRRSVALTHGTDGAAPSSRTGVPGGKRAVASPVPTFALLREKRRLAVRNPENGARFTISLRDWEEIVWSVRVYPETQWRDPGNPYTTAHRIMPRMRIEDWLVELRLA